MTLGRALLIGSLLSALLAPQARAASWLAVTAENAAAPGDATRASSTVSIVDLATGTAGPSIPIAGSVQRIAIAPDARTAYAAIPGPCASGGAVQEIDLVGQRAGRRIALGAGVSPVGLVVAPDGTGLYVGNDCDGTLVPLSLPAATVGAHIRVGAAPTDIAVAPDANTVLVSNRAANTVSVVNVKRATTTVRTVTGLSAPGPLTITPDGTTAFVADTGNCTITPITVASAAARPPIVLGAAACTTGVSVHGNPVEPHAHPGTDQLGRRPARRRPRRQVLFDHAHRFRRQRAEHVLVDVQQPTARPQPLRRLPRRHGHDLRHADPGGPLPHRPPGLQQRLHLRRLLGHRDRPAQDQLDLRRRRLRPEDRHHRLEAARLQALQA